MNPSNRPYSRPSDREFLVERIFNAPRPMVFEVFSKAEHLKQWFGPKGWSLPVCKLDFRPGGTWHYCMLGPQGEESWGKAVYREIVEPERIVYTDVFADAHGNKVEGTPEALVTLTFVALNGQTRLINHVLYNTPDELDAVLNMGMIEGLGQTWDRLEAHLAEISR
jgi:uncharacterized protein YndB with AHSA1/START domain